MSKSSKKKVMPKYVVNVKIATMIENGRKEITTKDELEEFPPGSLISYMNKNNVFKIGGFITEFEDDSFIYINTDFSHKYRVYYQNILKLWVGDVFVTKNDIVSLVKATQKKTNFPVKIGQIIVYYAKNNFDVKRFMNTEKYQKYINWVNYFAS